VSLHRCGQRRGIKNLPTSRHESLSAASLPCRCLWKRQEYKQYQTSDWNEVETIRLFSRCQHSLLISQHYRTVPTPSVSALHVVPPRPCSMGCTTGVASSGKTCIQPRGLPTSRVGVQGKGTVNKTFENPPLSLGPHLSRGSASHRRRRRKLTQIPTSKEPRWSTLWRVIGPGGEAQDEVKTPMVSAPPFRGDLGKFCLSQFRVPRDSSEFERLGRSAGSHYRVSLLAIRNACRMALLELFFRDSPVALSRADVGS
jgi:hypothetical protein